MASLIQDRVKSALSSKDEVTLRRIYNEMSASMLSRTMCTKANILQRVGVDIFRNINAEDFIPDSAKRSVADLIALRLARKI